METIGDWLRLAGATHTLLGRSFLFAFVLAVFCCPVALLVLPVSTKLTCSIRTAGLVMGKTPSWNIGHWNIRKSGPKDGEAEICGGLPQLSGLALAVPPTSNMSNIGCTGFNPVVPSKGVMKYTIWTPWHGVARHGIHHPVFPEPPLWPLDMRTKACSHAAISP